MQDKNLENGIENVHPKEEEDRVIVKLNPKIFPLEVVYSAAYAIMDKAYIIIDGDPQENLYVDLKPKSEHDLERMGREFNNELLNYAVYVTQAARNKGLREAIVSRALAYNSTRSEIKETKEGLEKSEEKVEYLEDPKGIAEPWSPEKAKGTDKWENDG